MKHFDFATRDQEDRGHTNSRKLGSHSRPVPASAAPASELGGDWRLLYTSNSRPAPALANSPSWLHEIVFSLLFTAFFLSFVLLSSRDLAGSSSTRRDLSAGRVAK